MNEMPKKTEGTAKSSNTLYRFMRTLLICITVILIACIFAPHLPPTQRLWTPVLVATNGDITVLGASRQLEFWTPSAKTKDYLHMEQGQVVPTETWEVISNDDVVRDFGMMLHTNANVLGYRRVEAWGHGRTTYKPGWWWTVDVFTNYTATDLARSYEAFWQSHQVVFVEVVDNPGASESEFKSAK